MRLVLSHPKPRRRACVAAERVLGDVRATVTDWKPMVAQLRAVIADIDRQLAALDAEAAELA